MDFQGERISAANFGVEITQAPDQNEAYIQQFQTFIHDFEKSSTFPYRDQLARHCARELDWIEIDIDDIKNSGLSSLSDNLKSFPNKFVPMLNEAARREAEKQPIHPNAFHVILKTSGQPQTIRQLTDTAVGSLQKVRGIVLQASRVRSKLSTAVIQCRNCNNTLVLDVDATSMAGNRLQLPRTCNGQRTEQTAVTTAYGGVASSEAPQNKCPLDPFVVLTERSIMIDSQIIKLQELYEDVPVGDIPRHISVILERGLVDKVKPGSVVNVLGTFSTSESGRRNEESSVRTAFLRAVGLETDRRGDNDEEGGIISIGRSHLESQAEKFKKFSQTPNLVKHIEDLIDPAIYGHRWIKRAIACQLFGGRRKSHSDGTHIRGDINVLLIGDPGTAKSQLLKFASQIAPISVSTSGKGSSAAGLTAAVTKEGPSGEWYLEGGAMVLADGGLVCIDEFDKMNPDDRVAIHEAMEQQTISIAKAGITTVLNSRCSVLAAANPLAGHYNESYSLSENIDFQTTILSRFDLIFIIRDHVNAEQDRRVAQQLIQNHSVGHQQANEDARKMKELKDYIEYARLRHKPVMTADASKAIEDEYVRIRNESSKEKSGENRAIKQIPITVRQLEAIIRISESFAKMHLRDEVTKEDARMAIELFQMANSSGKNLSRSVQITQ
ncbi:putative DNA replication licensing factor mcm5 [Blattamonas nauphoetae]|uniref:DNA replication licensing factor MCM5 n=1 Tax=Blattamonas nauphoetae TaxID=2049346 RepID=A0ABQ9XK56_9EUKA|nr:putative DNA replication licensing factor mcm5 [Blattamonas nauphoetae]